jgi:hypothetical protein
MSEKGQPLSGYVETAFRVTVKRQPSKLLSIPLYGVSNREVGFLKSRLRQVGCPSAIVRKGNELYLCFVGGGECLEVLNDIGVSIEPETFSIDRGLLAKIVHDAIRIELLKRNATFRTISGKLVDISKKETLIAGLFVKYDAYKTRLIDYWSDLYLAVDKTYKLEPDRRANLKEIAERRPKILNFVKLVKLVEGGGRSFVLRQRVPRDGSREILARKVLEFLGLDPMSVNWDKAELYEVQPYPRSYTLIYALKASNLIIGDVTYLPDEVLYPVASLDTIKSVAAALNQEVKLIFTLSPQDRLNESKTIIRKIPDSIEYGDLEIAIYKEPLFITSESKEIISTSSALIVNRDKFKEISKPDLIHIFNPREYYKPIEPFPIIEKIKIAIIRRKAIENKILGIQANSQFEQLKTRLKNHLANEIGTHIKIEINDIQITTQDLDENSVRKLVDSLKDNGYNVVIAPVVSEEEYAFLECYAAKSGLVPQSLDLSARTSLQYRALPIARHIEYKLGFRLALIADYPEFLGDHAVAALDATIMMFRGYAKLGVAPVITDPTCSGMRYLDLIYGENEEEVIGNAFRTLADEYSKALIFVNRASVPHEILEKARELFDDVIVIAVSKQGVPRLVKTDGNAIRLPERGVFIWHGAAKVGSFNEYFCVGVTNIVERDDLTPVTCSLRIYAPEDKNLNRDQLHKLLNYVQSSTMVFVESPMHLPSLPQPLHEAHRLSRKVSKIVRWVPTIELKRNVLEKL